MTSGVRILRSDAPERSVLERDGWVVAARSWGAQLDAADCDRARLGALVARATPIGQVRALTADDVAIILALDAATANDYPGREATAHAPLTASRATVSPSRRAYGIVDADGSLAAMTFVDIEPEHAEVDFTVVAARRRGRGLSTAVKAASVLDLLDCGVTAFRTGGSSENSAILAANRAVGFEVDEEWLTLAPPAALPTAGA
ncbi:acetyltransferase [Cellulomonas timonensis]|uniref:acetyltransferase n=1 Tax=Cellulomonas timonensis TaxID=1689271 RepID=UPI00083734AB|nr:acetyltransferase [Cellulomonas timonensis]